MRTFRGQGTSPVDQNIWFRVVVERSKYWISVTYEMFLGLFLYFIDRASRHKFLQTTNLMYFFMYLLISSL
jgi:hypothetical protein